MQAVVFLVAVHLVYVQGHAFLEDPPSRAYHAKYSTPQGINCGGISVILIIFFYYNFCLMCIFVVIILLFRLE